MIFSKSFGYSLRGVLYVALQNETGHVQLNDMSEALGVPRYFMGKIMKRLVHEGIIDSIKGPTGGFFLNATTLNRYLIDVYRVTDHPEDLTQCVLARGECSSETPCKLHDLILPLKEPINRLLHATTIGDLMTGDHQELLAGLTLSIPAELTRGANRSNDQL